MKIRSQYLIFLQENPSLVKVANAVQIVISMKI